MKMIDRNIFDLTDEDILSSLKVIATTRNCNERKIRITANAALELINAQRAEIERLRTEVNLVFIQSPNLQERIDEVKAKVLNNKTE